jgi:predicted molibdopterin-dependent oxidoreductase YjgC
MNTNEIKINGHEYTFQPGETILDVARRNGIYIPTLCYLKGAVPTGACRICVVEASGVPGLISSCSTPASANLDVHTDTPRIRDARRTVIEFLLISGKHNCSIRGLYPHEWTDYQLEVEENDKAEDICAAYGRCELQALAYRYQVTQRTLDDLPPPHPVDFEDPLIGRDYSRCILCGRCVYACNEIQVNRAIAHGYRGIRAKIVCREDKPILQSDCVYCGECLQVCPVGSLFEQKNRFNARMWEVHHVRTTCYYCGVGCQLDLHIKDGQIVRVRGAEEAEPNHDGRLCFRGRFAYDFIHSPERLTRPLIRKKGTLAEASWDEALALITSRIKEVKKQYGAEQMGCLVSTTYTNEDLFWSKRLFQQVLSVDNVFHFEPTIFPGLPYEELDSVSAIVVVGGDLSRDNPVASSYVKQAAIHGVRLIVVNSQAIELSRFASQSFGQLPELEPELEGLGDDVIVIAAAGEDVSRLEGKNNIRIFSLCRENNTVGAYCLKIGPGEDFDLSKMKFLYTMGPNIDRRGDIEFLVVQDIFPGQLSQQADVVLPAAAWVEYEGTVVSADLRLNRVRKAVDPPGEAKPAWWIFRELSARLGHRWEAEDGQDTWEKEIIQEYPQWKDINYAALERDGIRFQRDGISFTGFSKLPPGICQPNRHKLLCEHCRGMENVIKKMF